ncbi:MAG: sterol desaturase family protein [Bacteroidota bacterium]
MTDPLSFFGALFSFMTLRYIVLSGLAFWIFYRFKPHKWLARRIQKRWPNPTDYQREIGFSILSLVIFSGVGAGLFWAKACGWTRLYLDIDAYGWGWWIMSLILLIILHDTWFYWTHRLMHLPKVFPLVHRIHHLSHNPSPWAAFAFHPLEALLEIGFLPIAAMIFPMHRSIIIIFSLWMMFFNIVGHLGYELFPKGFVSHPFWRWTNTSTHHNIHHRSHRHNFGLYFNFWDRMMGTNHPRYEELFEEVVDRSRVEA